MRLTQSVLSSAGDCQLKAQFVLDPPAKQLRTGSSGRALGTGYHAGLDYLYRARLNKLPDATLPQVIDAAVEVFETSMTTDLYDNTPIEVFRWDDKVKDKDAAVEIITACLTEYMTGGHVWDWEILAVEHNEWYDDPAVGEGVQTKLGADLILRDPNGFVIGVDHKTANRAWSEGKENPRKNIQSPFYMRNMRRAFPGAPGYRFVFDVMVYPNTKSGPRFMRLISDPTPLHEAMVEKKARDFVFMYETIHLKAGMDLPANPASTLCSPKWCDAWSVCPYGAALEEAAA